MELQFENPAQNLNAMAHSSHNGTDSPSQFSNPSQNTNATLYPPLHKFTDAPSNVGKPDQALYQNMNAVLIYSVQHVAEIPSFEIPEQNANTAALPHRIMTNTSTPSPTLEPNINPQIKT